MMLVIPALVISSLVWFTMAAMLSWLVWKLWVAHKMAGDGLESTNASEVVQVPIRSKLTDCRGTTNENRHIDEETAEMVVDETGEASVIGL